MNNTFFIFCIFAIFQAFCISAEDAESDNSPAEQYRSFWSFIASNMGGAEPEAMGEFSMMPNLVEVNVTPLLNRFGISSDFQIEELESSYSFVRFGVDKSFSPPAFDKLSTCPGYFWNLQPKNTSDSTCIIQHFAKHLLNSMRQHDNKRPLSLKHSFMLESASLLMRMAPHSDMTYVLKSITQRDERFFAALVYDFSEQIVKQLGKSLKDKKTLNLATVINKVIEQDYGYFSEPCILALVATCVCSAHTPRAEQADEGVSIFGGDMTKIQSNPLLDYLRDNIGEMKIMTPTKDAIPERFEVNIIPYGDSMGYEEQWRFPLYRYWQQMWWICNKVYKLGRMWRWIKLAGNNDLVPGWSVVQVGTFRSTEQRAVTYANNGWRFKNINPRTMALKVDRNGKPLSPFEMASIQDAEMYPFKAARKRRRPTWAGGSGSNMEYIFREGPRVLKILKGRCSTVPTFAYINTLPFMMVIEPSKALDDIEMDPIYRETHWYAADAIIASPPTMSPKVWLLNILAFEDLVNEPELSPNPEAKMHYGYNLFFTNVIKPFLDKLFEKITEPLATDNSATKDPYSNLRRRFHNRDSENPFVLSFTGYSFGGAVAMMSSIYCKNKLSKYDNVNVLVVTFGAPSWANSSMFGRFDELGIIRHEIHFSTDSAAFFGVIDGPQKYDRERFRIELPADDFQNVHFNKPYSYNGSMWLQRATKLPKTLTFLSWMLKIRSFYEIEISPKLLHYHGYGAALSLMSGTYQHTKWMSHLIAPLVKPATNYGTEFNPEYLDAAKETFEKYFSPSTNQ